jgi:hypothetical protein
MVDEYGDKRESHMAQDPYSELGRQMSVQPLRDFPRANKVT